MINEAIVLEFNQHLTTGNINPAYLKEFKRHIFLGLASYLNKRQILIINGIRRVGKTTLMFQLMELLLKNKVKKERIFYFSFDDVALKIEEVINYYQELTSIKDFGKEQVYLFFDEIQKIKNWQNVIKQYYDAFPKIKFVLSGSANLLIDKRSKESLAGRFFSKTLLPLSFREYIELNNAPRFIVEKNNFNLSYLKKLYLSKRAAEPYLKDYIVKGFFFELNQPNMDAHNVSEYVKLIVDRIVFIDIPSEFEIEDKNLLKLIFQTVFENPGQLLDYYSLSQKLGRDRRTISKYVDYLKFSLLLKELYNYSSNFLTSTKKLKKAYPYVINPYNQDIGKLIENIAVINANPQFFFRDPQKREIDIILNLNKKIVPVEIKYQNKIYKHDIKSLLYFIEKNKLKRGIVVTKNLLKEEGKILFIPAWLFLLLIEND